MLAHDALGRAVQVSDTATTLLFGWSGAGRRVRLTATGAESLLYPEPDFEYLTTTHRVNKHFFVGDRRHTGGCAERGSGRDASSRRQDAGVRAPRPTVHRHAWRDQSAASR